MPPIPRIPPGVVGGRILSLERRGGRSKALTQAVMAAVDMDTVVIIMVLLDC